MSTADIARLIKVVKAFAPKTMFDSGPGADEIAIFTYQAMLGGLPYQDCEDAVLAHYAKGGTDVWLNAGQIRRLVAKRSGLLMPPVTVAWAHVEKWSAAKLDRNEAINHRALGKASLRDIANDRLETLPRWLAQIVEPIGAELLDRFTEPQWKRKAFTEAYGEAVAEHEELLGDMPITERELAIGRGAFSLVRAENEEHLALTAATSHAVALEA